jgi:hypothetical protein
MQVTTVGTWNSLGAHGGNFLLLDKCFSLYIQCLSYTPSLYETKGELRGHLPVAKRFPNSSWMERVQASTWRHSTLPVLLLKLKEEPEEEKRREPVSESSGNGLASM